MITSFIKEFRQRLKDFSSIEKEIKLFLTLPDGRRRGREFAIRTHRNDRDGMKRE